MTKVVYLNMNERKEFRLIRVGTAIPKIKVADVNYNVRQIKGLMDKSYLEGVNITVFPELCVTGYTCGDLFYQDSLLKAEKAGLDELINHSRNLGSLVFIIGATSEEDSRLINAAYVIQCGKLLGIVGKRNLPGYKEFYEPRWFSKSTSNLAVFKSEDFNFGIEICEDVWAPIPPSSYLVQSGADIIFNLSASNDLVGKDQYLSALLRQQSARFICGYVYSSAGYGESTQDLVYSGKGFVFENGKLLERIDFFNTEEQLIFSDIDVESIRNDRRVNNTFRNFLESTPAEKVDVINIDLPLLAEFNSHLSYTVREYDGTPFIPKKDEKSVYESILSMQSLALVKRLEHTGMKAIIGISGGSDSTWALLVTIEAMKKLRRPMTDIIGVTLPGFATSQRTKSNSVRLMELIGIDSREIDIKAMCEAELKSLGHDLETQDITYENVQARSRTQILMNLSNQENALVIGTGDLSEAALGWCTYNADHMSMYNVNCSIPKTLIRKLIDYYVQSHVDSQEIAVVLCDILSTPVSPELTGSGAEGENAQVTEDKIGPYELHDFFLYNLVRHNFSSKKILFLAENAKFENYYGKEVIKEWYNKFIKRFFSQQFKRSCVPDGPKIGSVSLSPRGDWRMPSDAEFNNWLIS